MEINPRVLIIAGPNGAGKTTWFFAGSCGAEGGYVAFKCMVFFSVNL